MKIMKTLTEYILLQHNHNNVTISESFIDNVFASFKKQSNIMQRINKAKNKIKGEVQRNKGLGSLEPEQARRSMFSEEFQRMDVMEWDENAINLLCDLMGEDVEPRRDFIFKNVDFSEISE